MASGKGTNNTRLIHTVVVALMFTYVTSEDGSLLGYCVLQQ
jgi:hypothetical protein